MLRKAPNLTGPVSPPKFLPAPEIQVLQQPKVYSESETKMRIMFEQQLRKVKPLRPFPTFERNPDADSPKFFYMDLWHGQETKDKVYTTICMYLSDEIHNREEGAVPPLEIPRWIIDVSVRWVECTMSG